MSTYTYLSNDNDNGARRMRLFGRERPIYEILGGGKAANILLWRDKAVSGAVFMGVMALWFLFEVAEYNLVTFLCHLTITVMLVIFIWSNGAKAFKWTPPEIPKFLLEESMLCKDICEKLNVFLSWLINIACGNDIKLFCLVILVVSMLSTIGKYITASNLLFIGIVCMGTLPYLYERHEEKTDAIS
ncbi:unnamed protein product [Lactuca virosa]|uniref:Reticulon-like protein n=1 Tax=Lactuca virosa TaxID=75947 RepID=A0AAU9MDU5_9ASTR|nr:unnamed protein product [Lactuca virosa]